MLHFFILASTPTPPPHRQTHSPLPLRTSSATILRILFFLLFFFIFFFSSFFFLIFFLFFSPLYTLIFFYSVFMQTYVLSNVGDMYNFVIDCREMCCFSGGRPLFLHCRCQGRTLLFCIYRKVRVLCTPNKHLRLFLSLSVCVCVCVCGDGVCVCVRLLRARVCVCVSCKRTRAYTHTLSIVLPQTEKMLMTQRLLYYRRKFGSQI